MTSIRAALVSATAALAMLAYPAAANAEKVWDIEAFDSCTELVDDGINESLQDKLDETKYCCEHTGGVWNTYQEKCQAPPSEWTAAPRGSLPTLAVQPSAIR